MKQLLSMALLVATVLTAWPASADLVTALAAARARYPATDVRDVAVTPLPGIYEFDMGGETVYGDASARYLILGRLVDMAAPPPPPLDYATLSQTAVDLQQGNAGEVILFSDPQCPYCVALEQRLAAGELKGYRVRLIFAPLLPGSEQIAQQLLCQPDPGRAYRQLMLTGVRPPACTGGNLTAHFAAVQAAGITGTPSLLAPTGAVQRGLPAPGALRAWVTAEQRRR